MRIFREYMTDKRGFQGVARGICFCELGIAIRNADESVRFGTKTVSRRIGGG